MNNYKNIFGQVLRRRRYLKLLKQKELSYILGVTEATISRYERGERKPSLDIVKSCYRKLGFTQEDVERITMDILDSKMPKGYKIT